MFTGTCGINVLAQIEVHANLETGDTHTQVQQRFKLYFRAWAKGERLFFTLETTVEHRYDLVEIFLK